MKRLMRWGLLLAAAVGVLTVAGCRQDFKVPASCKAKPGTAAEPYSKTGWAKEVVHEATGIELVYIPAGTFMIGSPVDEAGREDDDVLLREVQHRVTISQGFYMGKCEVTQAQWEKIMEGNPSQFKGTNLPVEKVSLTDCWIFCRKTGLCLPAGEQWEYACRAGTTGAYGGTGKLDEMGWYYGNSGIERLSDASWNIDKLTSNHCQTHPVGQKQPNAWGLYDMHGNVWEWCVDEVYPNGAAQWSPYRVCRGGSWRNDARGCRSAYRRMFDLDILSPHVGFRVVLPAVQ